ncbi:MAG TPA: DUF4476 domain-containing protein [Bacteroidales bacterium]|nr:DUF4476 domain-containing protein [Bacteroidales bacterium]HPS51541.1 DUF4476 domain-containing protein [Bacteroidales bacterium]
MKNYLMKASRIFILVTLMIFTGVPVFAQFGNIIVFAPKGEKFKLYIGNSIQNTDFESRVEASNPGGPSFKLKVVFNDPSLKEITKLVFNKPHGTFYYSVARNNKGVYILESVTTEWSETGTEVKTTPPPAQTGDQPEKTADPGDNKEKTTPGCSNPMAPGDFAVSLAGIAASPFEATQLKAAKNVAEKNCLLTSQVKEIMYVFDFESTRLSFARFAYDHTHDVENYADLSEALNSGKAKDDLERFIAGKNK